MSYKACVAGKCMHLQHVHMHTCVYMLHIMYCIDLYIVHMFMYLTDANEVPECSIEQWSVAMFISTVYVCIHL